MITPSVDASSSVAPPVPSTLPPLNVSPPSLGSKFAAHFTPLLSPSKSRRVAAPKPADNRSELVDTLLPPAPDGQPSSAESPRSSMQSRSTTPRPQRTPQSSVAPCGDSEDYSDLFLQPQLGKSSQAAKCASSPTILTITESPLGESSETPPATTLQFPYPPSTIDRPSLATSDETVARRSCDWSKEVGKIRDSATAHWGLRSGAGSVQTTPQGHLPGDEQRRSRSRALSHSGSDTDASRACDSSPRPSRIGHSSAIPRSSIIKPPSYQGSSGKISSNSPATCSLPSPPMSPSSPSNFQSGITPTMLAVSSSAAHSRSSGMSQRPRANTLSSATLLSSAHLQSGSSTLPAYQKVFAAENKAIPGISPDASPEELREALVLQRKKYTQLQEYIITITKRYEDDRVTLAKTIGKLERDIRKKTREIEGLRWLVIHHGAVEDIDAAANLARSSLSTHDESDRPATDLESSSDISRHFKPRSPMESSPSAIRTAHSTRTELKTDLKHTRQLSSTLDVPSSETPSAASSQTSLSLASQAPSKPLSAIPERSSLRCDISRAERQRAKEERRAARATRRISGSSASSLASGANLLMYSSFTESPSNHKLDADNIETPRPSGNG
ncbi:hypothetical protein EDC04DRAFT_1258355 [Pisolithus marmoratus]|nr:hypothetical protein EDC04DRAFT_1258355 [Pisolithus marmoratus]